jgi:hypothetical protein
MTASRIVATGLIGSIPLAGLALHYLQYVLGLRRLGHEVLYLEDTGAWYYDPASDSMIGDPEPSLAWLAGVMKRHGLEDSWTFVDHAGRAYGRTGGAVREFVRTSDLLLNVTGAGLVNDELMAIPRRVYLDTDPGYVQFRAAAGSERDLRHLGAHTSHFSFGCNIGLPDCRIPTLGLRWRPTVQPICIELWNEEPPPKQAPLSTILKWQTYPPVMFEGEAYGSKSEAFLHFADLPRRTGARFLLAMTGKAPLEDLAAHGWHCVDGRKISVSVPAYQAFIASSRAEWSIAKDGYVRSRSGWFGDRSASYLATGRPVLLQSTGYERWLPAGAGVLSFSTLEDAAAAVETLAADYGGHCRAARALAVEHFHSDKVLTALLETAS